jgi:pilus assembly protein CpaB
MRIFKNRTVLGVICIVIALIICFVLTPLFNAGLSKKTTVVRVTKNALSGEVVTKDMLAEVEVGSYNLPSGVCRRIEDVEGKYLTADIFTGDFILPGKVSEAPAAENSYLYGLSGEKQAISITIGRFAEGLSGKLMSGDIVSVIAPDYQRKGETVIPPELKYVEVIAVTAKTGFDANTETGAETAEEEKELPATVTLLATPEQSRILAELECEGTMHLSLVYRGTTEKAAEFIREQETVLEELFLNGENTDENTADTWNMGNLFQLFGDLISEEMFLDGMESGDGTGNIDDATDWGNATESGISSGDEADHDSSKSPVKSRSYENFKE